MDLFNKHYEKLILVVCLILMILALLKVSDIVGEANKARGEDLRKQANKIDTHRGEMVKDFNPADFVSKEAWIQRVKDGKRAEVISVARIMENPKLSENIEEDAKKWDRRYFSVLTRHSRKPIEETEAKYRLEKNRKELGALEVNLRLCEEKLKERIGEVGEDANDTRLAELRIQQEGYQKLKANIEMDIRELEARVRYITKFCTEQGSMVDPHEVVCCVNPACGSLILSREDKCPFCGTAMPEINPADDDGKDSDQDGLPDDFEKAHAQKRGFLVMDKKENQDRNRRGGDAMGGEMARDSSKEGILDPYNPADAMEDFDGDSFTNLEEYRFGTDIDDERSFPNPANYVRLVAFEQDKLPIKLMGINDGKAPREQKDAKWRARFSFLRKRRGREAWDTIEDNWEQVRVGKKIEAPDGKVYVLTELDEIEVDGKKVATATVTEYIAPVRPKRAKAGEAQQPAEEPRTPLTFNLRQDEECFFPTWYAQVVYFVSRNANAIGMMMNEYGRKYVLSVDGKRTVVTTRFKLEENAEFQLQVPVAKKTAKKEEKAPARRQNRRRGGMGMDNGMDDMMGDGGGRTERVDYELKTFTYKVAAFDRTENKESLTIKNVEGGKDVATFVVAKFDEEETYKLPDKQDYPVFYQGAGAGNGMDGGDMMMDGGMRGGEPGGMRGPGRPRR